MTIWTWLMLAACAALLGGQHCWLRRRHQQELAKAAGDFADAARRQEREEFNLDSSGGV